MALQNRSPHPSKGITEVTQGVYVLNATVSNILVSFSAT
jgi:hypothetical protein